ncbi:MAG: hypothetical protein ACREPI_11090 [Candidatus Dormibacterales bacterium]
MAPARRKRALVVVLAVLVVGLVGGRWLRDQGPPPAAAAAQAPSFQSPPPHRLALVTTDPGATVLVGPVTGAGSQDLGTFAALQGFIVLFSCLGPGGMTASLAPLATASDPHCDGTFEAETFDLHSRGGVTLRVLALPGTRWHVAVEAYPRAGP